jgi:hypothetical protein
MSSSSATLEARATWRQWAGLAVLALPTLLVSLDIFVSASWAASAPSYTTPRSPTQGPTETTTDQGEGTASMRLTTVAGRGSVPPSVIATVDGL